MSQFQMDNPYADAGAGRQSTSKLAIWSLICSLILCCPITTLLGPLLGLIGLAKIGGNPMLKGKGLAVAGILIGLLGTGAWGLGIYKAAPVVGPMFSLMSTGPGHALSTGLGGDVAGFKASFHGAGATASDAEAQAFLGELTNRYGAYVSSQLQPGAQPGMGQTEFILPYIVTFDSGTVTANTEVIMADQTTGQFIMKVGYIKITDADKGDLTYPAGP